MKAYSEMQLTLKTVNNPANKRVLMDNKMAKDEGYKFKVMNIGTKKFELFVAYSNIFDNSAENQQGEVSVGVKRNGRDYTDYTPQEALQLSDRWTEGELEVAIKSVAKELFKKGIVPSRVRDYPDDRYGELTQAQKDSFIGYCQQECRELLGRPKKIPGRMLGNIGEELQ